jgi:Flp pilus assembly protein TadG
MKPIEERMAADAGQSVISLSLILGLFLIGMLGFAVDLTNVWFHRQAATAAADAACQAGALDLYAQAAGQTLNSTGFTGGTNSDCAHSSSATMCFYAKENGYNGTGLSSGVASNSVSWTFPASVNGVTAGTGQYPFLMVKIVENIPTYLMGLMTGSHTVSQTVSSTCGTAQVLGAAPMVVLDPTDSGAFTYSGGGALDIVGGPSRGLQVNSSSSTAVSWAASGVINLSAGGPNQTGSDVGIVGGPSTAPTNGSANAFNGGTTGNWHASVLPVPDPFANVPVPASVKNITPTANAKMVAYKTDGCPDHSSGTTSTTATCMEYGPGYYPNGITPPYNYLTAIFLPGVYYLNGSLTAGGSTTLRVAKPSGYQQTDGVMFYFLSGSFNVSGCSGCSSSNVDNVTTTDITCDGSSPPSGLGMPSTLSGNVLYGMCAANGTYFESTGNDSTDVRGTPGSRGLLFFQDHGNTTQPTFSGSGALTFSGSLYFHSTGYSDLLSLSGGSSSGTYVLGEIVTDKVSLTGSGVIKLALSPAATTPLSKVGLF